MSSAIRDLPPEVFAKLSPHRTHESNWFKSLLCKLGWHRWYQLSLAHAIPENEVSLCRWCPKVKVDGMLYSD